MKYRIFHYPLPCDQELTELNQFLASHRITLVRHFVVREAESPLLTFVIEYVDDTSPAASQKPSKIDYRERLSEEQFTVFSRLRDLRKQLAEAEGVPLYTVFTNAQLADIVVKQIQTVAGLQEVSGLGSTRIEKYGERLVSIVREANRSGDQTK